MSDGLQRSVLSDELDRCELGNLLLGLFEFYAAELGPDAIVQVRSRQAISRENKSWTRKKWGIEGSFSS